jgi:hypothetical protein
VHRHQSHRTVPKVPVLNGRVTLVHRLDRIWQKLADEEIAVPDEEQVDVVPSGSRKYRADLSTIANRPMRSATFSRVPVWGLTPLNAVSAFRADGIALRFRVSHPCARKKACPEGSQMGDGVASIFLGQWSRVVAAHPRRKNKDAPRMGHPAMKQTGFVRQKSPVWSAKNR